MRKQIRFKYFNENTDSENPRINNRYKDRIAPKH